MNSKQRALALRDSAHADWRVKFPALMALINLRNESMARRWSRLGGAR